MDEKNIDIRKIAIQVIIALIAILLIANYNNLVLAKNRVLTQRGQVEEAYQRRLDLIPDLVKSVKDYTKHEEAIIENIIEARSLLQDAIDSGDMEAMDENSSILAESIDEALSLLVNSNDTKAAELYVQLNDEIAGSVNRISQARYKYNEIVEEYNNKIMTFPGIFYAKLFGFKPFNYLKVSQKPGVVKFD